MKKTKRRALLFLALILSALALVSCAGMQGSYRPQDAPAIYDMDGGYLIGNMPDGLVVDDDSGNIDSTGSVDGSGRKILKENPFISTADEPVSTFSGDVDTASYTMLRKMINAGYDLKEFKATAGNALRTEELVNYFSFDCPAPAEEALFGVKATVAPNPFDSDTSLLMLTLRTADAPKNTKNNLVFLIDVSGSMYSDDKLPLLKKAFNTLTDRLDSDDVVSIVTYAGSESIVLDGCPGNKKDTIIKAVNRLSASGSTNGEAGIKTAYAIAEKHFLPDGNNRIILASDGDLNVGISNPDELKKLVEEKRDGGVFLSVLGFGAGNYKDANMEAIADNGNGVYYYIDGETEAEKIFSDDLFKSLYTVAKDMKLQLTFRQDTVDAYRLVGYENRLLKTEDFLDDRKDAGDLGAGAVITVFYQLKLKDNAEEGAVFADLAVRAKQPDGVKSIEENHSVGKDAYTLSPDDDFRFAAAVVGFSLFARDSSFKANASLDSVLGILEELDLSDPYKAQFRDLLRKLK